MPKKKDAGNEDLVDVISMPFPKKHKKHKHKKHKRKKGDQDAEEGSGHGSPETQSDGVKPSLKLKIKIGGQTFGEKSVAKNEIADASSEDSQGCGQNPAESDVDEEEAWLEAVESGRLEEVDEELKRMKDPTLMTARQRALLESKTQKEKEEPSPTVYHEKEMTEEMLLLRMLRAKKRKQQAEEKREKDKIQTIERLLKKTDAKVKGVKKPAKRTNVPKVTYINNQNGISLSLPVGMEFPVAPQVAKMPPRVTFCGVEGCSNPKKYSCSKTGVPLCSFECYKKNIAIYRSLKPGPPLLQACT